MSPVDSRSLIRKWVTFNLLDTKIDALDIAVGNLGVQDSPAVDLVVSVHLTFLLFVFSVLELLVIVRYSSSRKAQVRFPPFVANDIPETVLLG